MQSAADADATTPWFREEHVRHGEQTLRDTIPGVISSLATVDAAVTAIARGEIVVVVDDEDRENEGDLVMAAQFATEQKLAFFVNHTSGVICAPLPGDRCDTLRLHPMVSQNTDAMTTAFTVTVDCRDGITTGISARDRAATLRTLADPHTQAHDLVRPGHVFPLRASPAGVLARAGHTEAAVDLCALAGLERVGVLSEIVKPDGSMARLPDLIEFAQRHQLVMISIADLIRYRTRRERLVVEVSEVELPIGGGSLRAKVFASELDGKEHIALVKGDPTGCEDVLVHFQQECTTGSLLRFLQCTCGSVLETALSRMGQEECSILVYLRAGVGLGTELQRLAAARHATDGPQPAACCARELEPESDRVHGLGAQILRELGVRSVRLLAHSPRGAAILEDYGVRVTDSLPLRSP